MRRNPVVLLLMPVFSILAVLPANTLAASDELRQRQDLLNTALNRVSPAVVGVTDKMGFGTGVVVSGDGLVLTASHVVEASHLFSRRRRRPFFVVFPDGSEYRCEVLGANRFADAAMLKITEPPKNGTEFPHVELGHSADVSRGDWCFALGHPGGFVEDRPAPVRFGRVLSTGYRTIVSDNAIVLGDSGGPLFDLQGRLIGIHSMITEVIIENRHVAIDVFHRDWDRLKEGESWGRLRAYDNELAETEFFGTVLRWKNFVPEVSRVIAESPADKAGIRPGDALVSIGGQTSADRLELSTLLEQLADEQTVSVKVVRNNREENLSLTTGLRTEEDGRRPRRGDREPTPEERERARELSNQLSAQRRVGPDEKRAPSQLEMFRPVVGGVKRGVVEFRDFGKTLALGTVMSRDGYVLTKASELSKSIEPECILPDGRRRKARTVAIDAAFDLQLLKISVDDLAPVTWSQQAPPPPGRIVITTDSRGNPILPGVVSVANRVLETSSQGFLGVTLQDTNASGVRIQNLLVHGAAERDGILKGDIVLSVDGKEIRSVSQMISTVKKYGPEKQIAIRVLRGNVIKTINVTLTARFVGQPLLPRYRDVETLGQFASAHNEGFPEALQHDTDLYPNQCGGPLLDISGEAVGLNIARAARITSYAIPAAAVLRVYDKLRKQDEDRTL